jgi:hypothetical protein
VQASYHQSPVILERTGAGCTSIRGRFLSCLSIASMALEIPAFSGAKGLDEARYPAQEARNCALGCLPQQGPQFTERHFDGVQVG